MRHLTVLLPVLLILAASGIKCDASCGWRGDAVPEPAASAAACAGTTTVAAQCKQGESTTSPGCMECTEDGTRCQRCDERWVLTTDGQCAQVSAHCQATGA